MHITPNTPRRTGRGARKLALAVSAAAAFGALAMPAAGQAATTFGSKLDHQAETGGGQAECPPAQSPCTRVAWLYPKQNPQVQGSPVDGVVVKFRLRSETPNPVTFRLARIDETATGAVATSAGTGPTVALKGDNSIEEFGAQVPIHVGDHLALDGAIVSAQYANDGGKRHYVFGPPLVDGQGARGSNDSSGKELLVQAVVEPDSDKDGAGDETQDKCPTDASTAGTCPTPDNGAPILNGVAFAPGSFRAAASGGAVASRAPVGARVFYRLSQTATVTWGVEKGTVGRKVGRRCVRKTRGNASKRRCLRFVRLIGSFKTTGGAGANGFRFTGRLNGHKLAVGSYKLVGVAKDVAGNKSKTRKRNFRIVK